YGTPQYDAVRFSLEKLNRRTDKLGVFLGIENRYSLHRFPSYDEIDALLTEFGGSKIAYWHDVGHAAVHHNLGLSSHESVLERFRERMIGIHFHDCRGTEDHLAPGMGEVDFDMIKRFMGPGTLRVLEVHKEASREELLEGIALIEEKGLA
ncbi:MAG: sugar phosphate isomerase/epimerase family protein, partial [Nitrospinota bacterium]